MLAEKLGRGEAVCGTMVRLVGAPAVAALAREARLDFVMVDMEHGSLGLEALEGLAVAGRLAGVDVLVRVAELARGWVSRALDAGAAGVMVPMVETAAQARQLVEWAKYPPLGQRGLSSFGPHTGYAESGPAGVAMERANGTTLAIAQIETAAAVAAIDSIAAVPGIDVLLIGPNDLAVSLGKPGDLDSPEEAAAIAAVAAAARRAGKVFAMHAGTAMLRRWVPDGLRLLMNSMDTRVLADGFGRLAADTRALVAR